MSASKAVLITGRSTGIGRATAERLASGGFTVYATARRPESISGLEGQGLLHAGRRPKARYPVTPSPWMGWAGVRCSPLACGTPSWAQFPQPRG